MARLVAHTIPIVVIALVLSTAPAAAAPRKECKASRCRTEIALCKDGCVASDECAPGEVCTATDPLSPVDFGNAIPGWSGQSCVLPAS